MPVAYFFENMTYSVSEASIENKRKCMDLVRNFQAIRKARQQDAVSILVRVLAEG